MGVSDVTVAEHENGLFVSVGARGGSRRERGAGIAAVVRRYPVRLVRVHVGYSETYGFQSMTYAMYRKVSVR